MSMPKQKPGQSEQVVCTPSELVLAVQSKLGITDFDIDLAASEANTVTENLWYTEEVDSLVQDWTVKGWGWCNPPYGDISPWVEKAYYESWAKAAKVAMLVPASVGSNWWKDHVHNRAYVLFLSPRITFVGHDSPYPKDLALLLYTPYGAKGYDCWRWK